MFSAYILDLDGTLFRGNEALPGAVETVAELRRRGAGIRYLTNNSSLTRSQYAAKLTGMGFEAPEEEVYSSGLGTAAYLRERGHRRAFVVGEPGLHETLRAAGIETVEEGADFAVVGICRSFSYDLLNGAMQAILGGAEFVATNPDPTYPLEGGRLIPGAGSIVAAVRACSGREPFVVGKPNPFLVELILKEAGLRPEEALVVGDRVDTDLESGRRAGCPTHLVLTGVTKEPPEGVSWSQDLRGLLGYDVNSNR
jgi:4-nitrophenyl phosphatase